MAVLLDQILWSKAYVWVLKKYSNPKTQKYWADVQNWVAIINPEIIASQLENAKNKIQQLKKENKQILLICEKILYRDEIESLWKEVWIHYLNYKVPGWVLTNFDTLLSRINSMNELKNYIEGEDFQKLTKKEKLVKIRQYNKLEMVYKWVKNLKSLPDFVIIVDGVFMSKFVNEVVKMKIDNLILSTTNFNRRWNEDNLILMNVNSYNSLDFVLKYILK